MSVSSPKGCQRCRFARPQNSLSFILPLGLELFLIAGGAANLLNVDDSA